MLPPLQHLGAVPVRVDRFDVWSRVAFVGQVAEGTHFAAQQGPWNHGTDLNCPRVIIEYAHIFCNMSIHDETCN